MQSTPMTCPLPWTAALAQQSPLGQALLWVAVVFAVIIAAAVLMIVVRRWHYSSDQSSSAQPFTLSDLRRLHREGQLSEEEFEKAKHSIIGRAATPPQAQEPDISTSSDPDTPSPPPPEDHDPGEEDPRSE